MWKALWSSSGIRPAYVVAACIFLVAATVVLLRVGVLSEGPLAWAAASPSSSDASAQLLTLFQSTLDSTRALQDSEARIQASLDDIQSKIATSRAGALAGAGAAAGAESGAKNGTVESAAWEAWQEYPSSDISKLLAWYPVGSPVYRELQGMRYCGVDGDGDGGKSNRPPESALLTWTPAPGRYLLPICNYGQISNRLNCLSHYMLLATLLNRTLVIPQRDGMSGYDYELVLDVEHARRCIGGGNRTVVTFREYLEMEGLWQGGKQVKDAVLDSIWCWKSRCELDKFRRVFPTGVAIPDKVSGWEYRKTVSSVPDLLREFGGLRDPLVSFGDLYNMNRFKDVAKETYTSPNLPFAGLSCKLVVQPHVAVILAAKGLARTIFGPQYMAVHIRRGDFHHAWGSDCRKQPGGPGNFSVTAGCNLLSIGAIANCILEKLEGTGINMVFVATNAKPTELTLLERLLASNPRGWGPVTLVRRPEQLGPPDSFYWADAWNKMGLNEEALAHTALDKLLCAMAKLFMGSRGSTFTDDIVRMRAALGTLSCQDQRLCAAYAVRSQDELPTFNVTFTDPYQGTRNYRRRSL